MLIAHLTRDSGENKRGINEFNFNNASLVAEGRVELPALGL
jgi:hypothetical protein